MITVRHLDGEWDRLTPSEREEHGAFIKEFSEALQREKHAELVFMHPPTSVKMHIRGKAPGSNVEMHTTVRLEELASDQTRLHWDATAEVRGSIASIGARLLKGTARRLADEFWETFAQRAAA